MTRYLISFDDGTMTVPDADLPAVGEAAHAVMRDAKDHGVWVHGGGLHTQRASVVAIDGTVSDGPFPEIKAVLGLSGRSALPPPAAVCKRFAKSWTIPKRK